MTSRLLESLLAPKAQSLRTVGLCALLALIAELTPVSEALTRIGLYEPYHKLRAAFSNLPEAAPELRIVVVDDRSLKKLGRVPTFAEWQALAARLAADGFETFVLQDPIDLAQDLGDLTRTEPVGRFVQGAAAAPFGKSSRTVDSAALPERLLLPGASARPNATFQTVLAPSAAVWPMLSALGHVNAAENYVYALTVALPNGRVLPHLSLAAAPDAQASAGDGLAFLRYVSFSSVLDKAVPADQLFEKAHGDLVPRTATLSKKLDGGKVALFVASGFTGSRAVRVPIASVSLPAYLELASQVTSSLERAWIKPLPFSTLLLAAWLLLLFLPVKRTGRHAALFGGLAVMQYGTGLFALSRGWILPAAEIGLLTAVAMVLHAGQNIWRDFQAKSQLEGELRLATGVQDLLMSRTRRLAHEGMEMMIDYRPFGALSGDWYQTFSEDVAGVGRVAVIAIGDVVGKGPAAALVTSTVATVWQQHLSTWRTGDVDVDAFIRNLNAVIHGLFEGELNTTMSLAAVRGDAVTLAAIGASRWIRVAGPAHVELVQTPRASPLGMGATMPKNLSTSCGIAVWECLLAYTDGVLDSGTARSRFLSCMKEIPTEEYPEAGFLERLSDLLLQQGATGPLHPDDRTLMALRRLDPESKQSHGTVDAKNVS